MSTVIEHLKTAIPQDTKYKILIIDDSSAIHNDFYKIFSSKDHLSELDDLSAALFDDELPDKSASIHYELTSAYQGEEGYQKVLKSMEAKSPYTLAFVDMRMPPGWDGLETIERLWEADPDLQIILCTAYSDYSWLEIFERIGQNDRLLILKKPFDNSEVCQMAAAMCAKRKLFGQTQLRLQAMKEEIRERTRALQFAIQDKERDASRIIQTLHELKQTQATLLQLSTVGQLATGIAHEINIPVQFVGDNIRVCSKMFDDALQLFSSYQSLITTLDEQGLYHEKMESIRKAETTFDLAYIKEEISLATSQSLDGVERVRTLVRAMKEFSHGGGVLDPEQATL